MTNQLAINFERPAARRSDPPSSHGAAVIAISRAATHREMALQALRAAGERGLSDFELARETGVLQTSIGCRRLSLQRAGLVAPRMVIGPDGALQQDTRPSTTTGSPAGVYVAIEHQRADAKGAS